jgi:hypothetical protein
MGIDLTFRYDRPFEDEKQAAVKLALESLQAGDVNFDHINVPVLTLSNHRVITSENAAFRDLFLNGRTGIGFRTDVLFPPPFRKVDHATDALILDGVASVEMEHIGVLHDGRPCTFLTYKRRLDELKNPSFSILVVSRPLAILGDSEVEKRRSLNELVSILRQLDEIDQFICRAYGKGDSTKDIACSVGLTSRSVELRRQKILDQFGFDRPIEIVKLLVRLEEHGLFQ